MKSALKNTVSIAAAAGLAAAATLTGGTAAAQLPGVGNSGDIVRVDADFVTVTVDDKGEEPTEVTGSISNTSGDPDDEENNGVALRCATPGVDGQEFPGQVTEADVVARAMQHYGNSFFSPIGGGDDLGGFDLGSLAPGLDIGSVTDVLPSGGQGPLGSLMGDPSIADAQALARDRGRTGDPLVNGQVGFDLAPGETLDWAAQLAHPINQDADRGEWQAGAMFFCSIDGADPAEYFVFAGYEGGEYVGGGGSGSLSTDSLTGSMSS